MASMPERTAVLEEQVRQLVRSVDSLSKEVHALSTLAADGKSRLAVLFWLASLFSGAFGATVAYVVKTWFPMWPR
jgi:hypothetical protein